MHYTGMAAMRMAATISYDPFLFALSVFIAIAASTAALYLCFNLNQGGTQHPRWLKGGSALVMGAAIVGMHYTGIAAATFMPVEGAAGPSSGLRTEGLGFGIGAFTLLILSLGLVSALLGREFSAPAARLRASEARTDVIVKTAPDAILTMSGEGLICSFNPGAERIFGYSAQEAIGQPLRTLMPERFRGPHEIGFRRYLVTGEAHVLGGSPVELAGLRKNGEEFPLELTLGEMREDGDVLFTGIIRDVTERKRIEQEKLQMAEHIRLLLESTDEGIYGMDVNGRCTIVNRSAARMFGYEPEELLGRRIHNIVHHSYKDKSPYPMEECPIYQVVQGKEGMRIDDEVYWRRDGTSFPVEYSAFPVYQDGVIAGSIATFTDITERKRAEEDLRRSEERFRLLSENAQDVIYRYRVRPNPSFEYVSPSVSTITGYTPEEHYADPELGLKLVHPDDRHLLADLLRSPAAFDTPLTLRWIGKDGRQVWTEQRNKPTYDPQGKLLTIEGIARDVTQREQAEEELRKNTASYRVAPGGGDRLQRGLDPGRGATHWHRPGLYLYRLVHRARLPVY